jgi:hypothetical protein
MEILVIEREREREREILAIARKERKEINSANHLQS